MRYSLISKFTTNFIAVIISSVVSSSAFASGTTEVELRPESQQLLSQLENKIDQTLLTITQKEASAGKNIDDLSFYIDASAQGIFDLGLIIDEVNNKSGVKVISVSPGSIADKAGIKPNEYITKINHLWVDVDNFQAVVKLLISTYSSEELTFLLVHNDTERDVIVPVDQSNVPSFSLSVGKKKPAVVINKKVSGDSCGRVSTSIKNGSKIKYFHHARISQINDESVLSARRHSSRILNHHIIPTGKHTIWLTAAVKKSGSSLMKGIEIDVQTNMIYHLAAKYDRHQVVSIAPDKHWTPEVWKVSKISCEL